MVQSHGRGPSREYFAADLRNMMVGKTNHPAIMQWTLCNEHDCICSFQGWKDFGNANLAMMRGLIATVPGHTRLIDLGTLDS
jgi:hypothetical protein